jgi:hypothetical protein
MTGAAAVSATDDDDIIFTEPLDHVSMDDVRRHINGTGA